MTIELSIITVNFNNEVGLEKTIKSVLSQSFKNYEFIIIDGDSDDNSIKIIKSYSKNNRIIWKSEPDTGIFNAMNKGIKKARGNYLLFLNSGDVFLTKESLNSFLHKESLIEDIIYGDYKFEVGEKIYPDNLTPLFFFKSSLPHQSTIFKKTVFEELGSYNENYKIASDREFYIKCFLNKNISFKHIKMPLILYDLTGISNSESYKIQKYREDEAILKEYFDIFYQDYVSYTFLEKEINRRNKKTIQGLIKRINFKFKYIFSKFK